MRLLTSAEIDRPDRRIIDMECDDTITDELIWRVRVRGRHPVLGVRTTWFRAVESALDDTDVLRERAELKLAYLNPAGGSPDTWTIVNTAAFCPCRPCHHRH